MTRMTGPDCVVMCNLINTYIHGGVYAARLYYFRFIFPVQQTTSEIGHRVKKFSRVGTPYAECEKHRTTPLPFESIAVTFL